MINSVINYIKIKKYRLTLRRKKVKLAKCVSISENTTFEGNNYVGEKAVLQDCCVGKYSYVAKNTILFKTKIGRYTSIGPNVHLLGGEHPTRRMVSTCPAFYVKKHDAIECFVKRDKFCECRYTDAEAHWILEIGNDVWVASDVRFVQGVKIGDGAIIAAGAVVTKSVPDYAIVGGIPAKIIRFRFETDEIEWLKKVKWWEMSDEWISDNAELFEDINKLRESMMQR